MIRTLLLLLLAAPLGAQQIFDLLIRGGHVIDPASGRNGRMDVAVAGGRVVRVAAALPAAHARVVVEAGDYYVTPGLIDLHAHFDTPGGRDGVNPDHNTLRFGVTTAVDAGSAGWRDFEAFRAGVMRRAKVRLLAFLNIGGGIPVPGAQSPSNDLDPEAAARIAKKYPQIVAGILVAHAEGAGWEPVARAVKAAELSASIVMVDFQGKSPAGFRELWLEHLRPGDIHTHAFRAPLPLLEQMVPARKRGILFDLGFGAGTFRPQAAADAIHQDFHPDTISTGLDRASALAPRATLTNVISRLLAAGMTLDQVIPCVTVNAARAIRRPELGTLAEGAEADIAVLKLDGPARLRAALTVRGGEVVWDTDGLSAGYWEKAGPYSNFK